MKRSSIVLTAAFLAATTVAAVPAFADDHHDRRPSSQARSEGDHDRGGRAVGRAVPREAERPAVVAPRSAERPVVVAPRVVRPTIVRPEVVRPYYAPRYVRPYYARPYYARPYVFRPRFSIGLGVIVGYPVPYSYGYPYPVPVYGYSAPPAPVVVGPNSMQYGGVSLEISPSNANVYVDGAYAGVVEDFDGTRETLTLAAGRHHVEITAPGYSPMVFDVDVLPGQTIPYQGGLQPLGY